MLVKMGDDDIDFLIEHIPFHLAWDYGGGRDLYPTIKLDKHHFIVGIPVDRLTATIAAEVLTR